MLKKIIILLLVPFCMPAMQPSKSPERCKLQYISKKLESSQTIIAFDLDEVVLTGREPGYKKWIENNPDLGQAIGTIKKKYNLSDATAIINKTAEEYPNLKEKALEFQKVVITAPRIHGTEQILEKLSKKGYGIVAASNMTTSTYQGIIDNKTLPEQFTKNFFFVATNELNKKPDGTYFEKPSPEYYQNLLTYINQKYPRKYIHVIFIDDKEANAEGAKKVPGIMSIQFKNPEQLLKDLQQLGIDID